MQAAPVRSTTLPSVTAALRAVESLLLRGGQRTARRNAWASVVEDRRRAKDRIEAQRVLDGLTSPGARPAPGTAPALGHPAAPGVPAASAGLVEEPTAG